jgi:hypothetical protein
MGRMAGRAEPVIAERHCAAAQPADDGANGMPGVKLLLGSISYMISDACQGTAAGPLCRLRQTDLDGAPR